MEIVDGNIHKHISSAHTELLIIGHEYMSQKKTLLHNICTGCAALTHCYRHDLEEAMPLPCLLFSDL